MVDIGEIIRVTDVVVSLACVLVSRLMFNLREPERHSVSEVTTTVTPATSSILVSTTLLHTLTKIDVYEATNYESRNHQGGLFHDACSYGHLVLTIGQK